MLILRSHGTETLIEHLECLAKCGVGVDVVHDSEVGVVQEIERFCAKLQGDLVVEGELTSDREVDLVFSKSADKVSRGVTDIRASGRLKAALLIERLPGYSGP